MYIIFYYFFFSIWEKSVLIIYVEKIFSSYFFSFN